MESGSAAVPAASRGQFDGTLLGLLNVPAVALVVAFSILPLAYVLILSLQDLRIGMPSAGLFAGLENYRFVLDDPSVWRAAGNTLYFVVASVAIAGLIGLGIALLLDSDLPGAGWLVFAVVLPWAIPEIVNALMWQWILNPTYGSLNGLLTTLGAIDTYRAWLSTPISALHAVIFAYAWKLVPFVVIILYAGLRGIPAELFESAALDGAGTWAQFRHVTLPLLKPALAVALLFCLIWSMRAFDIVYLLTRGGPGEATTVLSYFVFAKAFEFGDLGAAAAVACLLALLTIALTSLYLRALRNGRVDP